jgi:hypothetical protein
VTGDLFQEQRADRQQYAERYRRLFLLPFVEIPPAYMTFAFSDPTVRIVDIRGTDDPAPARGVSR